MVKGRGRGWGMHYVSESLQRQKYECMCVKTLSACATEDRPQRLRPHDTESMTLFTLHEQRCNVAIKKKHVYFSLAEMTEQSFPHLLNQPTL